MPSPSRGDSLRQSSLLSFDGDGNFSEERAAIKQIWNDFMDRTRRDAGFRTNFVQSVVSTIFLILTMIGTCRLGRSISCSVEPWMADVIPVATLQLGVNLIYLLWPDVIDKYVGTKIPLLVRLALAIVWIVNLMAAGILVVEGLTLGTSYRFIHISRFILSVAELVCAVMILITTARQYLRKRGSSPHLPR